MDLLLIVGKINVPIAVTKVERSKNSKLLALVAKHFITAVRNVKWNITLESWP
jgi:hypothetical protein